MCVLCYCKIHFWPSGISHMVPGSTSSTSPAGKLRTTKMCIRDRHDVGEVAGQAVLHAVHGEGGERGLVHAAEVDALYRGEGAHAGVGGEVLYVHLEAVGGGSADDAGLELGEVIVHCDGLNLDRDVGVFLVERLIHPLQRLLVAAGGVEVAVCNGYGLGCDVAAAGRGVGVGRCGIGAASAAGGKNHQQRKACRQYGKRPLFHFSFPP